MRCLVVADLHYSLPQFDWLLAAAPQFDVVIFAGDALDVGSLVDFRAQILVVKKYLTLLSGMTRVILCSGNHDLDERSAEGEKISRWVGEVRELGIACDGDSLTISEHALHGVPMVGRTAGQEPPRNPASRGCGATTAAMDLGPSCAAGKFTHELGRQAIFWRCRTRAVDQRLPAVDGDLGSRASVTFHPRRLLVRPARHHLGIQHRPAARPPTGLHRARPRSGCGLLASGRRRAMHRPARAIAAAGNAYTRSAALAHILGSDCRWHAPCRQIAAGGLHCPDLAQRPQALYGLGRCLPSADLN